MKMLKYNYSNKKYYNHQNYNKIKAILKNIIVIKLYKIKKNQELL